MDIMKIFTILLIVTIVILVFNLIKVEPFVPTTNAHGSIGEGLVWIPDDAAGAAGAAGIDCYSANKGNCTDSNGCKWNSGGCIDSCWENNEETCTVKEGEVTREGCGWRSFDESYCESKCLNLYSEQSCNTESNTCVWKSSDFGDSCEPRNEEENCWSRGGTTDECQTGDSCKLITGYCENTKNCYNLDTDTCNKNEDACKLDGYCNNKNDTEESNFELPLTAPLTNGFPDEFNHSPEYVDPFKQTGSQTIPDATKATKATNATKATQAKAKAEAQVLSSCNYQSPYFSETNVEYIDCNNNCIKYGELEPMAACNKDECGKLCSRYENQHNLLSSIAEDIDLISQSQLKIPSITTLLEKEEYLLRSLDSMANTKTTEDNMQQSNHIGCSSNIFNSDKCPKQLVSRYNRIVLNLNYIKDTDIEKTPNVCIVTINLNYECKGSPQESCGTPNNSNCKWDDEKNKCKPNGGLDNIEKLIVNYDKNDKNLSIESGILRNPLGNELSCERFYLRKICSKKQYIDLYDQYTEKYFIADPNVNYNDMYILQPFFHESYTLQVNTDSGNDYLVLNRISGNKNEQFEKIHKTN
jgi:hypothetical protein